MMIFPKFLEDRVLGAVNDGNLVRVSTTTLTITTNAYVLKPQGVDERLNLQHGEAQCQVHLPQSFMEDTIFNPMGGPTFSGVSLTARGMPNSTSKTRTPTRLLGVVTRICQTPFFLPQLWLCLVFNQR